MIVEKEETDSFLWWTVVFNDSMVEMLTSSDCESRKKVKGHSLGLEVQHIRRDDNRRSPKTKLVVGMAAHALDPSFCGRGPIGLECIL